MGRPFQSLCSSSYCSVSGNLPLQCFFDKVCIKPVLYLSIALEVKEMLLLDGRRQDVGRGRPVNTVKSQKKQNTLHQLQFASCMQYLGDTKWVLHKE